MKDGPITAANNPTTGSVAAWSGLKFSSRNS